jgi:threonine dehydrogenase-like Zn-dependent dehydrogenase
MNALWLENNQILYRRDVIYQDPKIGEALIHIRLAGICSTDLELIKGYYPYKGVLGHEFVGEVVAAPGHPDLVNQRVVGEINITCGECDLCCTGLGSHCKKRTVLGIINHDGVFAEYTILPVKNLHQVPANVPDEVAVFTEPLAAALEIQQQIHIHPTDRVLIVGAGRLGQLVARSLVMTGCDLVVLARHQKQRDVLKDVPVQFSTAEELDGINFDVVVEATGSSEGFDIASHVIRPRGTIILKSTYHGKSQVDMSKVVVDEIKLIGSRCGPFQPALSLLASRLVDPTPMIETRYPLSQGVEALNHAAAQGILKVLLYPD